MSSPSPSLVTIGETLCVFATSAAGPLRNGSSAVVGIAGAESNVAIGASRLGASCAWVGRVGDDPMGRLILRELRAEGLDLRAARLDPEAATGVMLKERRTTGLTRVTYCRKGSAGSHLTTDDVPRQLVEGATVLHVSGVTLGISQSARAAAEQAIRWARGAKVIVSFDVNYRRGLWAPETARSVLRDTCTSADIVFASAEEASLLAGTDDLGGCLQTIASLGPETVVIKLGAQGCIAAVSGEQMTQSAVPTEAADVVGAGDAFAAGYLVGLITGLPPSQSLALANQLGGYCVSVEGDWDGLPALGELDETGGRMEPVLR